MDILYNPYGTHGSQVLNFFSLSELSWFLLRHQGKIMGHPIQTNLYLTFPIPYLLLIGLFH
jgi:hypothetical protein